MRNFFLYAIVSMLFAGCTSVRYIPVESLHYDSVYVLKELHDTLRTFDSIYVEKNGDTVRIERWNTKYKSVHVKDTVTVTRTDTIYMPYEVKDYGKNDSGIPFTKIFVIFAALLAIVFLLGKKV